MTQLRKLIILFLAAAKVFGEIGDEQYDFEPIADVEANGKSFNHSVDILTQIKFFVNSTAILDGSQPEIKIGKSKTLTSIYFNKSNPVKILVHGFMGDCGGDNFPNRIIKAYRDQNTSQNYNLICIDWGPLSNQGGQISLLMYRVAVDNAIFVGKRIAEFIKYLVDKKMTNLQDVHLIGFSLGAHVAGTAGYIVEKVFKEKIGRITGLDPAGPFFDKEKPVEHKLDLTDASFVDVIHTNFGKLGIARSIGHVDFYPNGGRRQPQCIQTGDPTVDFQEEVAGVCSHYMAPKFYALSLLKNLVGCKCPSWKDFIDARCTCRESTPIGENCNSSARGDFYSFIKVEAGNKNTEYY